MFHFIAIIDAFFEFSELIIFYHCRQQKKNRNQKYIEKVKEADTSGDAEMAEA